MGDIIQEEKKIGRLFAEAFGLTIAENFFSTQIPADKINAAALIFRVIIRRGKSTQRKFSDAISNARMPSLSVKR